MKSLPNNALSHQSTPQNPNLAQDSLDLQGVLLADVSDSVQSPQNSRQNSQNSAQNPPQSSQNDDIRTYQLDAVNINSVGDDISENGISEGILNKGISIGPLDNKKVMDMPYQVNTVSRELLENQVVQGLEDAVKYFPSVQLHHHGSSERVVPHTRGMTAHNGDSTAVVGFLFWDGFHVTGATSVAMAMFESLQVQNGPGGALYGSYQPAGAFNFVRKRPKKDYNAVWFDFISRGNLGVGLDTSDKFQYMGYRIVLFSSMGEREPANAEVQKQIASFALDFYPLENLVFETNFNYYKYLRNGYYAQDLDSTGNKISILNGVAQGEIPSISSILGMPYTKTRNGTTTISEQFVENAIASAKFKYTPISALYLEGGFQYQRAIRNRGGGLRDVNMPTAFLKAQGEFETGIVKHNLALSADGFQYRGNPSNSLTLDMKTVGLLYNIGIGEYFELIASGANSWFKKSSYKSSGLSYSGSLIYKAIPEHLNVYFSYIDSIRASANYDYDVGITTCATNPSSHPKCGQVEELDPYRTYQFELGLKARVAEIDFSAAVFQITRPTFYLAPNAEGYNIFGRQGEQRNRGVELTAGGNIIEPLSVYGGFTLVDAVARKSAYKQAEGKKIIGEPLFQANMLFDFAVPYTNKVAFSANFHYTSKRYVDDMNTKAVDGYFTTDLGVRYVSKKWLGKETTIRFNVNNVFNEKYWAGVFPAQGSTDGNIMQGTTSTSLYRGYDRTFMLSGQVKF